MQILLIRHDIQALIEMVGFLAVNGGGDIPGVVEGGAVGFQNQARGHAVFFQVHNLRAVGILKQALILQFLNHPARLVGVKAFPGVAVKMHVQHVVHLHGVPQGHILEPLENFQGFPIAVLDLFEPGAAFVLQGGIVLGFFVKAHVQAGHFIHAALFHLFLIAPFFIGADHFAKLGAPIPQMVDGHGFPPLKIINAFQGIADDRGA